MMRLPRLQASVLCAAVASAALVLVGCSRETDDWRSTLASDTSAAYQQFLRQYPGSSHVNEANTRMAQLAEDQAWEVATSQDSREGYQQFVARYPEGKWAQEARVRIENFSLAPPSTDSPAAVMAGMEGKPGGAVAPEPNLSTAPTAASATAPAATQGPSPRPAPAVSPPPAAVVARTATPAAAAAVAPTTPKPLQAVSPPSPPAVARLATPAATAAVSAAAQAAKPKLASAKAAKSHAQPQAGKSAGRYGVQLGAFSTQSKAEATWAAVKKHFKAELAGARHEVVAGQSGAAKLYRLRVAQPSQAAARGLCQKLKARHQACVVVHP